MKRKYFVIAGIVLLCLILLIKQGHIRCSLSGGTWHKCQFSIQGGSGCYCLCPLSTGGDYPLHDHLFCGLYGNDVCCKNIIPDKGGPIVNYNPTNDCPVGEVKVGNWEQPWVYEIVDDSFCK